MRTRNSHSILNLLVGVGVGTAIVMALIGLISRFIYINKSVPYQHESISLTRSPIFYKTLAEVPNVPQGSFNYGGSTTFAPLGQPSVISAINRAHPQFQLHFTKPKGEQAGSGTGIKMLLAGELSFAQSSQSLQNTQFGEAKKRGFSLEQLPVAIDAVAFYVNPGVSIPGLSLSQLRDIFTGKTMNWKQVGGPDQKITAFSRNSQVSGTAGFVKEKVLAGEEFSTTVQEVEDTTDSIRKVAKTPGGIGYATASEVIGQKTIHPLPLSREGGEAFVSPFAIGNEMAVNKTAFINGSYPLTRRLFVIIKRDGGLDQQAGIAYVNLFLSDEGQRLVESKGFVAIR